MCDRGEPSPKYSWYRLADAARQSLPKGELTTFGFEVEVGVGGFIKKGTKTNKQGVAATNTIALFEQISVLVQQSKMVILQKFF